MIKRYLDREEVMRVFENYIETDTQGHVAINHLDVANVGYFVAALPDADVRENFEAVRVTYDQGTTHYYTCGKCGNPIDYEDRFCRHCGARIKEN